MALIDEIPELKPALNPAAKASAAPSASANNHITIRGARTHNLKGIDVDIPHNALTVISGVSGSGKSSLAFDTIYAEGQRRYVESLSAYARQFLERIEKPDVDHMDGLAPAIAIKQKNQTRNPRSTVATATEIYDYLRLLYARCGTVTCLHCGGIVRHDTIDEIITSLFALREGTRANVLFPVIRAEVNLEPMRQASDMEALDEHKPKPTRAPKKSTKKTAAPAPLTDSLKERLAELRRRGYNRLYQQLNDQLGKIVEFSTPESLLELDFTQPIFVLIDRLVLSPASRARIVDAIETGYREAGEIVFQTVPREDAPTPAQRLRFSAAFECSTCHRAYREPEPRLFSFNNPYGACPRCQGFGNTLDFDPNLIIPDKSRSLDNGAIDPWNKPKYRPFHGEMKRAAKSAGVPTNVPWYDLTPEQQSFIEEGSDSFPGIRGFFAALERKKYKLHVRVFLSKYRGYALCPDCRGQRLRPEARAVLIAPLSGPARNICEVAALTISAANEFFDNLQLSPTQMEVAGKVLEEVRQRTHFLHQVGLDYLTLDRLSSTLSGGESQRIQLASSLGSRLVGALYVQDEPSIGLHTRDTAKLIHILFDLRDLGNTILVVEHDPDVIRSADHLLDLGPGAGELGGRLLAEGTVAEVTANPASITGRYLSGASTIPVPKQRRVPGRDHLTLTGARIHNLRGVDVDIPLNLLCCVTGVSGSGKSTLVHQVLYRGAHAGPRCGPDPIRRDRPRQPLTASSQGLSTSTKSSSSTSPPSAAHRAPTPSPTSRPSTKSAPSTPPSLDAKRRSLTAGSFSFNVPGGRCDTCEGDGTVTVEMQFLADVELPCEECNGARFKPSVLSVKYKNKNIHDVLNMTVKQAIHHFAGHPKIVDKLSLSSTKSASATFASASPPPRFPVAEAQRAKLAFHLARPRCSWARRPPTRSVPQRHPRAPGDWQRARSRTLYILDEPTTGLHFDDVAKLLAAFRKLIEGGGSLLVIEHNLDVIKSADWVIDMGPEGGSGGGQVVAVGTPEEIAANPASHTGHWLAPVLRAKRQRRVIYQLWAGRPRVPGFHRKQRAVSPT